MKTGARILIVEDEPLVGAMLAAEVESMGFRVLGPAVDLPSARALLRTGRPEVVLLDFDLGSGGSSQALAEEMQRVWKIPVVIVSGHVGEADFERAVVAMAPSGVVAKPVEREKLGQVLSYALGGKDGGAEGPATRIAEGVVTTDLAGLVRQVNPAAARMMGVPADECLGREIDSLLDLRDGNGQHVSLTRWARAMGQDLSIGEWVLLVPGGGEQRVTVNFGVTRSAEGGLTGMTVVLRPSAPAAEAEGEGQADEPWRWLEQQEDVPVVVLGADETVIYANPAAETMLGHAKDTTVTRAWEDLLKEGGWDVVEATRSGQRAAVFALTGAGGRRLAGQAVPFENGHFIFLRDASQEEEERRQEERARRLEDLGYLARGYSHELNNRLTVILGGLSRLESHVEVGGGLWREDLEGVRQAAAEAAGFVRQIGVFSQGGKPARRMLDIRTWMAGVWGKLPRRAGVDYRVAVEDGLPMVAVDPVQLERAMENLVRNASEAVPVPGGLVGVWVCRGGADGAGTLDIRVRDNGPGVEEALLPRLTEPYFTTRGAENATGLGLTVCEAIMRAHGGKLEILSPTGQGMEVRLVFPLPAGAQTVSGATRAVVEQARQPVAGTAGSAPGGGGQAAAALKVLVLEDEAMVRKAVCHALRRAGWEVVETETGEEALAVWQAAMAAGRRFDVLVSDLTIRGGMGGVETVARLREVEPDLRAVACSGYSDDPVMSEPGRFGFVAALPKPFDPPDLVAAVRLAAARH